MLLAKKILAENFRSVEDAVRAVEKINDEVSDLLNLQKQYQKQVATVTAAGLMLEVNIPSVKTSPAIDTKGIDKIKVASMEKLRKNYAIVQDLWHTRTSLDAMESKIRTSFSGKAVDPTKAISEVAKLKKRVDQGLQEAFAFLRDLAAKHVPAKFEQFNEAICKILEKSIAYSKASLYTYLYEVNGDPTFSTYIQLQSVTDEDNNYFPSIFIVTSFCTGKNPGMYLATMQEFVPPSDELLMKQVTTIKEAINAINTLLSLDHFTSSIGSLPIALLLKDRSIKRELFVYQQYIKSIEISEDQIVFVVKPEITDKNQADAVIGQIWKDFQSLVRKTNAKLRMAIKKGPKSFILTFFFVTASDAPQADESDLAFLKERFNLADATMNNIIRTINTGTNS